MIGQSQGKHLHCDVAVIGAGPGGSSAAYWLARAGADVLLLDKAHFPRNKPCGDGLTPHAINLLETMGFGIEDWHGIGRPFYGVRIIAPDGRSYATKLHSDGHHGLQKGMIIPRRDFDNALREHAISAGARFLSGFAAISAYYHQGQIAGLKGRYKGNRLTITAPLVIIATGANRILLQTIGLAKRAPPQAMALRAYVTGLQAVDNYLEIHLKRELLPGYAWIFSSGDSTANIGLGIKLNGMTTAEGGRRLRLAFRRFLLSDRLAGARLVSPAQGFPIYTDFPHAPISTAGILVVGEAAGLVDPLTGEGIAFALESGQLAAEAAAEALRRNDYSKNGLYEYERQLRERYAPYFTDARELITRLAHPEVLDAIISLSRSDPRIREALSAAVVSGRPRDGIDLLNAALFVQKGYLSAKTFFTLSAYRPLLQRCRAYILEQVSQDTPSPTLLELLKRGKMLRALLVFLGCEAAGGDPEQVLAAAGGIELVHAASLIHDDIMDNATTRRDLPAIHQTLGVPRAIVCGDYLIAKAFRLLAESRATSASERVVEAFIIGSESGIRACRGQFQDVGDWTEETLNEVVYNQIIAAKTAAPIAGALMAGAALAGAEQALLKRLATYGDYVGRAFQIHDDVVELSGISKRGDSIDRRPMLPLIHAFQYGNARERALIRQFFRGEIVDLMDIVNVLQTYDSISYAEKLASSLVGKAVELARTVPNVHDVLESFAHYVVMWKQ